VRYASDIQFDFLRDGMLFAVVVLAIATLTPNAAGSGVLSSALDPLREPWHDVQEEWGRLFSSLNYQGTGGQAAFGDTLTLGGPRELGDTVIMDVESNAGRYWRAVAYDTFTGRRWLSTSTLAQNVDFGNHVLTPEFAARREMTQTITTYNPAGNVLFAAPQPLRVSLKAQATLGVIEEREGEDVPIAEVAMLRRRGPQLEPGERYLVVSSLSDATIEDLQEASIEYPEWVNEHYLDVPSTLPDRVADLAQEVTADAETNFDKALALEQFLRGFTYNDQIPAPPPGADAVDYFLFDVQQGYCDYYASAFAMMARSLGIPARVSAGYNQGEFVPEINAYRIREFNGHSWPEVFFTDYGWVEFEPTASEVEIVRTHRPDENELDLAQSQDSDPLEELEDEERFGEEPELGEDQGQAGQDSAGTAVAPGWWIGIVGMVLLVAVAAFVLLRPSARRRGRVQMDPEFTARLYGRLLRWAHRLRLPLLPSQTPHEHAAVISGAVPDGQSAILSITDLYVREQYSSRLPQEWEAQEAVTAWDGLQPRLRRAWFKRRVEPVRRFRFWVRRGPTESNEGSEPDDL
jgi:hypothetical protein